MGVAEVKVDYNLQAKPWVVDGFRHYENIHTDHIKWQESGPSEITWHGEHVGYVLEIRPVGYSMQQAEESNRMINQSATELVNRYPGAE